MKSLFEMILITMLVVFAAGGLIALSNHIKSSANRLVIACNEGAIGTNRGPATYVADAAIATRYRVVKAGAAAGSIDVCGVSDVPKGICLDTPAAAAEYVAVDPFGGGDAFGLGVATGSISRGNVLVPGASGAVRALPAAAGTYWAIGQAEEDAADGAQVRYQKWSPSRVVVT